MSKVKKILDDYLLLSAKAMHNTYKNSLNGYFEALIIGGCAQIFFAAYIFEGITVQMLALAFGAYAIWHHCFSAWAKRYLEKHENRSDSDGYG